MILFRDISTGGVQRNLIRLARHFVDSGNAVDFVVGYDMENEFALDERVRMIRLNSKNAASVVWRARSVVKKERPDILLTAMPNYNVAGLLAKLTADVPTKLVISERSHSVQEYKSAKPGVYKMSVLATTLLYRYADAIVSVSDETADSLSEFAKIARDRITTIHNPVVSADLIAKSREELDHPWVADGIDLVVATGRLVFQKDYPTLLKAFRLVANANPRARLVILGDGPDLAPLSKLRDELDLGGVVEFHGFDANPFRWFSRAKVFALSSIWEGLPTVVIEAIACGATVVATDSLSGPRSVLRDGEIGFLTPVGDFEAFGRAVVEALAQPYPRDLLAREALRYSDVASFAKFDAVFDRLSPRGR